MTASNDFISLVDFDNQPSPFYNEHHHRFRKHVRNFVEKELAPYAEKWEDEEKFPRSFIDKCVEYNLYTFPFGYGEWEGQKWDPFYLIIFTQEMSKPAVATGAWIHSICITPLMYFGNNKLHSNALEEIKTGKKLVSLGVSELRGGSDVANIETTAVIDKNDSDYYIINGNKYWITGGHRADYFVALARTDNKKDNNNYYGVSLFLIPRIQGVYTSKIKLQGGNMQDTSTVTFVNVKLHKDYLIGKLNHGFLPLMYNFNRERYLMACEMVGQCCVCVNESISWAKERKTFNTYLINHQVIRHKLAEMSRLVLASHALLEKVGYQLMIDPLGKKDKSIAKNCALLKVQCSKVLQYCSIEASQIFGGRSFVRGGRGAKVERIYRSVRAQAISGGSEEILLDLAVRQAKL